MKYNLHHGDPQRTFSLEDFLRRLDDGMLYKDIHWAPQTSILPYSLDKYDFVGKFENIEEDLNHIMKEIFNESYEIRTVNHHRTASMEMLKNLSIREISLIERLYEKDFINFDYDT
jgi:hypothetical protein